MLFPLQFSRACEVSIFLLNYSKGIFNLSSCSTQIIKLLLLASYVEQKIIQPLLPERFGMAFDGWSLVSTHYVALFAMFYSESTRQWRHF